MTHLRDRAELIAAVSADQCANHLPVSGSIKDVLSKNPEMATDFIEELINLHRNGEHDARHGESGKHNADSSSQSSSDTAPLSSFTISIIDRALAFADILLGFNCT